MNPAGEHRVGSIFAGNMIHVGRRELLVVAQSLGVNYIREMEGRVVQSLNESVAS